MKAVLFGLLWGMAIPVLADHYRPECGKDYRALLNKQETKVASTHAQEVESGADQKKLHRIERRALADYKAYFPDDEAESYTLVVRQFRGKKDGETKGYKASVSGMGDESTVNFYYKSSWGTDDVEDRLLRSHWDNQTPVWTWVCESY